MGVFETGLVPMGGGENMAVSASSCNGQPYITTMGDYIYPYGSATVGTATAPSWFVLEKETPKKGGKTMFDNVKGYVDKHKDMLFTLGLVILVDHFLFQGALRTRIKTSIEGVLKKVEDRFHQDTNKEA